MKKIKYLFKDAFAVMGKTGQGSADNNTRWINSLWDEAGNHFSEIENIAEKTKTAAYSGGGSWMASAVRLNIWSGAR